MKKTLIFALTVWVGISFSAFAQNSESQFTRDNGKIFLSLDDAVRIALSHNLDIRVQELSPQLSDAYILGERSIFDPTFKFNLTKSHYETPISEELLKLVSLSDRFLYDNDTYTLQYLQTFSPGTAVDVQIKSSKRSSGFTYVDPNPSSFSGLNPSYDSTVIISITQPLLKNFGRRVNRKGILVARNNAAMSDLDFAAKVDEVLYGVVSAYWDVVHARENLVLALHSLELAQELYDNTQARVEVGLLAPIEMAQAEAGVASREENIVVAESILRTAEDSMKSMLNLPLGSELWADEIVPTDEPLSEPVRPDLEQALSDAMTKRPEVLKYIFDLDSKRLELAAARNQKLPGLDLTGSWGYGGTSGRIVGVFDENRQDALDQALDGKYNQWSVGVNFTYPLFNRSGRSGYRAASLTLHQTEFLEDSLRQAVNTEVRATVREVETNRKRILASGANRVLQEKKLAAETERYKNGLSTSYQVLQFQDDLTTAEVAELRAVTDYEKSLVKLDKVTGSLRDKRNIQTMEE